MSHDGYYSESSSVENVNDLVNEAQLYRDQAIAAATAAGVGQTWQNVSGSRVNGTTYTNSTGKSIMLYVSGVSGGAGTFTVGAVSGTFGGGGAGVTAIQSLTLVIPNGISYSVTPNGRVDWLELR